MYAEGEYVNCQCSDCEEGGCRLDLAGMTDQVVVLDMNKVRDVQDRGGDICDCGILFNDEAIIAAVELKGGQNANVAKLVSQIQGGLDSLAEAVDSQHVSYFYPILMYKSRRDPSRGLAGVDPLRFRGMRRHVMAYPCGTRLSAIVDDDRRRQRRRSS